MYQEPGERSTEHRRLNQIYLLVLEGLLWRSGLGAAHHRDRALAAAVLGGVLLEVTVNPTIEPVVSRAASGQATNREGVQPHPSKDN